MMTGRLFEKRLVAIAQPEEGGRVGVASPAPGYWRRAPARGALVAPGGDLGELEIVGEVHRLVAPAGARGVVVDLPQPPLGRVPVDYGARLALLDPAAAGQQVAPESVAAAQSGTGPAFRATSSGRFYSRPAPSKPPFVEVGQEIERGHTIGLLEVMKTYSRLAYGGDELPARARVVAIRPDDGDDLAAGDVILDLEPI